MTTRRTEKKKNGAPSLYCACPHCGGGGNPKIENFTEERQNLRREPRGEKVSNATVQPGEKDWNSYGEKRNTPTMKKKALQTGINLLRP